jgi:hypothetical protein
MTHAEYADEVRQGRVLLRAKPHVSQSTFAMVWDWKRKHL